MKTNSKLPPIQQNLTTKDDCFLSIKSKQKSLIQSQQIQIIEIQDIDSPESFQQSQRKYFPIDQYKDFLKGEKIYLQVYYKDKVFISGYEPYIIAMGGQVVKRITSSTTIVLTNQMSHRNYLKLQKRIQKICKNDIHILSILWIQQIYRQKIKAEKQPYMFNVQTDITNFIQKQKEQQDLVPGYFFREVVQQDFMSGIHDYIENFGNQLFVKIGDAKKPKQRKALPKQGIIYIQANKISVFQNQQEQKRFKQTKDQNGYNYFYPRVKKQRKKNRNTQEIKRPTIQRQKRRRKGRNTSRMSQIVNQQKKQQKKEYSHQDQQNQQKVVAQIQGKTQQSDTEFMRRIKQKHETKNLNDILNQYLGHSQTNQKINQRNLTHENTAQINDKVNHSNETKSIQEIQKDNNVINNYCQFQNKQQQNNRYDDLNMQFCIDDQRLNNISQQQNFNNSNVNSRRLRIRGKNNDRARTKSKNNKKSKIKQSLITLQKTKTEIKSSDNLKQNAINEMKQVFKVKILQFLSNIGFKCTNFQNKSKSKTFMQPYLTQDLIYNVVIRDQTLFSHVQEYNDTVKQKLSKQRKVYFNIISFQTFNKYLSKNPIVRFLIKFHSLVEKILQIDQKSKKMQYITELLQLRNVSKQQIALSYQTLMQLITSEIFEQVTFYYFCYANNKQDILMAYLSQIDRKNILDYKVIKNVYQCLNKNSSKFKNIQNNNNSFNNKSQKISQNYSSFSQISDNAKLKQTIQNQIFPNFQIKARLTTQIIAGKKVTCMPINLINNVQYITKNVGTTFINIFDFMYKSVQVDIVVNTKRTFSKGKNIWQPDYSTFVNSLIVIQ